MSVFDDKDESLGTILVVDDEPSIQNLLLNWLEASGFNVKVASNGLEALEVADKTHPDAIVMDASMPIMGGFEALSEFKRRPGLATLPVMMLTVHNEVRDIVSALDMGAADYMSKPFNPQVLMARLRALIRLRNECNTISTLTPNPVAMISLDKQGVIISANETFTERTGKDPVGKSIAEVLPWLQDAPWSNGTAFSHDYSNVTMGNTKLSLCKVSGLVVNDAYVLAISE